MTDDEIRALVRQAVERHLGVPVAPAHAGTAAAATAAVVHPSMSRYQLTRAADDTTCLIEPAVQCNHCGYCQCHGH